MSAAAAMPPPPSGGALIDIPLDSGGAAGNPTTTITDAAGSSSAPRGRGVSRAVAEILTSTGKPVKATLAGCKLAGELLARECAGGVRWTGWVRRSGLAWVGLVSAVVGGGVPLSIPLVLDGCGLIPPPL
jgi:hypothetical protein